VLLEPIITKRAVGVHIENTEHLNCYKSALFWPNWCYSC